MRTVLLALALLAFPLTAQEPEPPVNDDAATIRMILDEEMLPLNDTMGQMEQIMAEQLKVMQEQAAELKALRQELEKLKKGCK
jgi:Spy/CpxP family protein refolding chaperone